MFRHNVGLQSLLKDGGRHLSGGDEQSGGVMGACSALTEILEVCYGPMGMKKLIINHIGKKYASSDGSTLCAQLEVRHPAAKLLSMAVESQVKDFGDCGKLVILLAGEMLRQASELLKMGYHVSDVISGYERGMEALNVMLESPESHFAMERVESNDSIALGHVVSTTLRSKLDEASCAHISSLLVKGFTNVTNNGKSKFDIDNLKVVKILGRSNDVSELIQGVVVLHETVGQTRSVCECRVLMLNCGLELRTTETKGTVLFHSSEQLESFTPQEEKAMSDRVGKMKDLGVNVVIVHSGGISPLAIHYCDTAGIAIIKIQSKFDMKRIGIALGAQPQSSFGPESLTKEVLGTASKLYIREVCSKAIAVMETYEKRVMTLLVYGGNNHLIDEAERAINQALWSLRNLQIDHRFLYGAAAFETAIANKLLHDNHDVIETSFAKTFYVIPTQLARAAGVDAHAALSELQTQVAIDQYKGLNALGNEPLIIDTKQLGILEHFSSKKNAIHIAYDAAISVMKIDEIIMAKPAGGPKPPHRSNPA